MRDFPAKPGTAILCRFPSSTTSSLRRTEDDHEDLANRVRQQSQVIGLALVLSASAGAGPPATPVAPSYPDHSKLLVVRDASGEETPVTSASDWDVRRAHIMAHLQEVMGPLPGGERRVPLDVRTVETFDEPTYVRHKITYASEPGDRVPAWLLVPKGGRGKATGDALPAPDDRDRQGRAGRPGGPAQPALRQGAGRTGLRRRSCPDYPGFGEYKIDPYAMGYASASMKAIWNHLRAVDLLAPLPDVDADRIGVIGHSLGGHNSIFVALFDPRLRAVVSSCGFNSFPSYYKGKIAGWSHKGYMPRLASVYDLDLAKVPFDFPELVGALAPRGFFTNSPLRDANFEVDGVKDLHQLRQAGLRTARRLRPAPRRLPRRRARLPRPGRRKPMSSSTGC